MKSYDVKMERTVCVAAHAQVTVEAVNEHCARVAALAAADNADVEWSSSIAGRATKGEPRVVSVDPVVDFDDSPSDADAL